MTDKKPTTRMGKELKRITQITNDYSDSAFLLKDLGDAVTVFGSARLKEDHKAYQDAFKFSKIVADYGLTVITGGGPAIMEAANKGASHSDNENSQSVAVSIQLPFEEEANKFVDVAIEHKYFFTRKMFMTKHALFYYFGVGGSGSLDELFEVATLMVTGKMKREPLVLVGKDFWTGLVDWMYAQLAKEGTLTKTEIDNLFIIADSGEEAAEIVIGYHKKVVAERRRIAETNESPSEEKEMMDRGE
jgi:uncharacterized protein (TIGR00730 family)